MSHRAEDCFGKRSEQNSIRCGLRGHLGSRSKVVKQYKKSQNKWKKDLKALNEKNKKVYSIFKKFGSCRELKKIKKIKSEAYKKLCNSIIDFSINEKYYDSSLSRDSN